jgi:hypothetical protein
VNPGGNIGPRDNAWHEPDRPNYIEWWYADAVFASGHRLAGSFGLWGDPRHADRCVVRSDFRLATPAGPDIDFGRRVPLSSFRASSEHCDVQLGSSYLCETDGCYRLHLQAQGGSVLDLALTPACPGFGHVHFIDGDLNRHFSWVVAAPRATFVGALQHEGTSVPLEGLGYHDHNWASVSLSKELRGWRWGRFHGDDTTLIFAAVEGVGGPLYRGMALIESEDGVFGYRFLHFGVPDPTVTLDETPRGWDLLVAGTDVTVRMRVEKGDLLLRRADAGDYCRFLSAASGSIHTPSGERRVSGLMVHEIKQLR